MTLIFFFFLIYVHSFHAWSYNPNCWIGNCVQENPQTEPPSNLFSTYLKKTRCWLTNCADEKKVENNIEENSNSWFPNCELNNNVQEIEEKNILFEWFGSEKEKIKVETKNENWYCNLKKRSSKKLDDLKNYLNAAKPQDSIIENIFSAELSPYCWFNECCNINAIPGDTNKLKTYLKKYVYGQPLVDIVVDAINSHWNAKVEPKKALVMSFHGGVGTGKNYVANFISNSLYKLGSKSEHVHHFSGRVHATLDSEIYRNNIYHWLKGNVTKCSKQLFIFDEVDKMPESVVNAIKPMLDYKEIIDGADYRNAIFIFISNTGADIIEKHYGKMLNSGKEKMDIESKDFEKLISDGAFHEKGGFHEADAIKYNLIDHYIPFLPLDREEVTKCVIDSFNQRQIPYPLQEHIELVLSFLERTHMVVNDKMIYSNGCKQVFSKVGFIVAKYYKVHDKAVDFSKTDL